ncbi:MAG: LysR family transcriptional regulator [Betaproteobacteria bacterium]|jgi:DNA-binding transcriptional LysR family regulator
MGAPLLRHPLHKTDLKLLTCLDALLVHRQVSKAARALDMDQPAMSSALARLRELFDDPLFTRVGQGMAPTPRAILLAGPVRQLLQEAERVLALVDSEPDGRVEGVFHIMVGADFVTEVVLPVLATALEHHMPSLQLVALAPSPLGILDAYVQGQIDLGIGYMPKPPPALYRQLLFREPWSVICRQGHPLFGKGMDTNRLAQVLHVHVSPTGSGHYDRLVDGAFAQHGLQRKFSMTLPHFEACAAVVEASHLVALVPQRVARSAMRSRAIEMHSPPLPVPPIEVSMFWHETARQGATHQKVRRLLVEHFQTASPHAEP